MNTTVQSVLLLMEEALSLVFFDDQANILTSPH